MRIRTIKPEFWRSKDVASLSKSARLTFIGIWNYVDDNGVGDGELSSIVADLYAADMILNPVQTLHETANDLLQLFVKDMLIFYTVNAQVYVSVVNWSKHQHISRPSKGHSYPEPPGDLLTVEKLKETLATTCMQFTSNCMQLHENSCMEKEKEREKEREYTYAQNGANAAIARVDKKPTGYTKEFETFWETYPRKRDKRKAFKAFTEAKKRASLDEIMQGAQRYRDDPNRIEQFTKYAEGWLRADGWLDAPLPPRDDKPSASQTAMGWLQLGQTLDQQAQPDFGRLEK